MRLVPILLACISFCSTCVGGMAAVRFRDRLHFLLGFSSGAVLAVALFDILPEVFALGGPSYMPIAALGFLTFFGLERYIAHASTCMPTGLMKPNWARCRQRASYCTAFSTESQSESASRPARMSVC
jgi:zinc transporter ZupT